VTTKKLTRAELINWIVEHRVEDCDPKTYEWDKRIKDAKKYIDTNVYWYWHDRYAKYSTQRLKKVMKLTMFNMVS
jgi:hypothetical protein